ncbi:MAG TPA: serine/threonine-protein kinase [Polyangia bacterium]|nr:serine/threonine-protein kinase [Polyangia bacterium]
MPVGDASPPAADDPLIGTVVSERYRILRKVGEGGMGAVYQAEHALIEKRVALKILFADLTRRPDLVMRFLQEAKSASRIGQENVIDISDFGQSPDGLVYIAMEFLEGEDLGRTLKAEKHLPWLRARPILMQITKALRAAHAKGIIHRDMKPENVYLIQKEGRPDFVKVLDFGIAKVVSADENDGPRLTQTGMIFGTPEYMSPEQAQGHPPDHRVDVYAVGCIMYHMLTGAVPFTADSFMGILTKHLLEPVIPPRQRRPELDIPADVEAVCLRAMEKERDKRYPDMDAFYKALGEAGGVPFEPSNVFLPPMASLKYPRLTETNQVAARESKTAISVSPPARTFEDERPQRAEAASAGMAPAVKIGLGVAGAVVVAVVLALALRGGPAAPSATAAAGASPARTPATMAGPKPGAPAPATQPPAAAAAPPVNAAAATEAAPAGETAEKPAAHAHHHHEGAEPSKPDPLHRKIDVPAEPTPAELKNPFSTP